MALDNYKRNKNPMQIFMALRAFEILHKRGEINFSAELVIHETKKYLNNQIIDRATKKEITDILNDDDMMEMACRRIALSMYFNKQLNK